MANLSRKDTVIHTPLRANAVYLFVVLAYRSELQQVRVSRNEVHLNAFDFCEFSKEWSGTHVTVSCIAVLTIANQPCCVRTRTDSAWRRTR